MVGLPGQRWPEIEDIKRFMVDERPDKWIVSLFACYPGSDIWLNPIDYAVTYLDHDLSHYWNFATRPTVAYECNPAEEIWKQYMDLKSWLEANFGRH